MCDSMYAGAKKTACGYNIFAKSSDRSPNEPQPLIFVPAADHAQIVYFNQFKVKNIKKETIGCKINDSA